MAFGSKAAGPFVAAETESGTVSAPASAITDTTASAGRGVKFGAATPPPTPPTPPPVGVPTQRAGWWWSDLESVPLGVVRPNTTASTELKKHWTWFGQNGQENEYGYPEMVTASSQGIPAAPAGDKILKLHHARGDTAVHHKLFKTFTTQNWTNGQLVPDGPSPADVSGRYISYMYVPSAKFSMTSHGWVNMFQYKENIITTAGFQQDPTWLAGVNTTGTPGRYVLKFRTATYDFTPYMDKWVKWEMRLYQGQKIEWYLNDRLIETGLESQQHVGSRCRVGGTYNGATITDCKGWVFGVGNYTSNQNLSGSCRCEPDYNYIDTTVYVDLTTLLPL
ncbi:MAG TPA: hypothetical protein VF572_03630 [Candidatus Saccharimonadales bacterium]